jgi:hypothetical protein
MWTLTVSPDEFDSPEQAYLHVGKKRLIAELVRALHRKGWLDSVRFFYCLEFQENGWPHWHLVVETAFVPIELVRGLWNVGHVWYSDGNGASPEHAANYVTKYVAKPDVGFPEWVMNFKGNMRRFSTSRGLCEPCRPRPNRCCDNPRVRIRKTPRERVKGCGSKTVLLREELVEDSTKRDDSRERYVTRRTFLCVASVCPQVASTMTQEQLCELSLEEINYQRSLDQCTAELTDIVFRSESWASVSLNDKMKIFDSVFRWQQAFSAMKRVESNEVYNADQLTLEFW